MAEYQLQNPEIIAKEIVIAIISRLPGGSVRIEDVSIKKVCSAYDKIYNQVHKNMYEEK